MKTLKAKEKRRAPDFAGAYNNKSIETPGNFYLISP